MLKKTIQAKPATAAPPWQPACAWRVIALDPSVRGADGAILTATIEIPNEELAPGPRGYRVQVIDYDATNRILYKPGPYGASDLLKTVAYPDKDREFQARNVYAIVMRVLARFERALGRRVRWSFPGHQLTIAPHAFRDLNAFYSKDDRAILFGYYPGENGTVFTCLSHEVIAHETTHALVDGLRDGYLRPSSPDQAAFHEGFADVVALFSVLSLREVVSAGLDLGTSGNKTLVKASALTENALKQGVLLGLAKQVGETMYGTHGVALRRSIELPVSTAMATSEEFTECHRRGELLVAAVLGAFLKVWKRRIDLYGKLQHGEVSRIGVVDAGVETADHLLTMAIRALDYCPPTDLLFSDFLSAMLTADYEMQPDDSRHEYRRALLGAFAALGFQPASGPGEGVEPGVWGDPGVADLRYGRTHFESMRHDKDEIFRFLWENRAALKVDEDAYTKVEDVMPCYRVGTDGFLLHETVAVYSQQVRMQARTLKNFGLTKPEGMPAELDLNLFGGGALIFDESGRLKYHVRNRIRSAERQDPRLAYLWTHGGFSGSRAFGLLHLERVLGGGAARGSEARPDEEDHAG
jgi:hypothetical protein